MAALQCPRHMHAVGRSVLRSEVLTHGLSGRPTESGGVATHWGAVGHIVRQLGEVACAGRWSAAAETAEGAGARFLIDGCRIACLHVLELCGDL